jgi:hypothetical protein
MAKRDVRMDFDQFSSARAHFVEKKGIYGQGTTHVAGRSLSGIVFRHVWFVEGTDWRSSMDLSRGSGVQSEHRSIASMRIGVETGQYSGEIMTIKKSRRPNSMI